MSLASDANEMAKHVLVKTWDEYNIILQQMAMDSLQETKSKSVKHFSQAC